MKRVLLVIALLLFIKCSFDVTGTVDETDVQISLTGYIFDNEGEGVANIVARLAKTGFSDTTDSKGIYEIAVSQDSLYELGISLDTLTDSIEICQFDNIVTKLEVSDWVDTLPEVYLVQRNIYGKLNTAVKNFKRIEAVIANLDDPGSSLQIAELWFNTATYEYSGFVYFTFKPYVQNYRIYINVYNEDSLFTGRSETVNFNSIAGDIHLPDFNPFNTVPVAGAGSDFSVYTNNTITLKGTATDAFGGTIVKWEWDAGNTGTFIDVSPDSCYTTAAPSSAIKDFPCILRVTDNDANVALDTVNILVTEQKGKMIRIFAEDYSFRMGSMDGKENERPVHEVTFTNDFWIDTTEVTQAEYDALMSLAYPSYSQPFWSDDFGVGDNYPAYNVSWFDAVLYCNALSKAEGLDTVYSYAFIMGAPGNSCELLGLTINTYVNSYRLPTEAEWEYTCRAGTQTEYYWGYGSIDEYAWHVDNSSYKTSLAGTKLPNKFGLYDMSGNVSEFCNDYYDGDYYKVSPGTDPTGPKIGRYRAIRGGNYWYVGLNELRSASRDWCDPNSPYNYVGFRVVLPVR